MPCTATKVWQLALLPAASTTVSVTATVSPTWLQLIVAGLTKAVSIPQLSLLPPSTAAGSMGVRMEPAGLMFTKLGVQTAVGASLSTTVTAKLHEPVLPAASVAT